MKRVLRVVTLASATGKYGGPFDTSVRQVRLAQSIGYEMCLAAGTLPGDAPPADSSTGEVYKYFPVRSWTSKTNFSVLFSLSAIQALRQCVRASDAIHVSIAREAVPITALLLAISYGKPIVAQPHGMLTSRSSPLHRIFDLFLKRLVAKSESVIALTAVESAQMTAWLPRKARLRIETLGNPIPTAVEGRVRVRPVALEALFIARLHPRKRVEVFIDAARTASGADWDEAYRVVGPDGGDSDVVIGAQDELSNFSYEGTLSADDVTLRVQRTGVFVLSSLNEPWGNVLALAIASGVPVVVPRSAALAPWIDDYGAGIIFEDGDSQGLADAVHVLLSENDSYSKASMGAIKLAEEKLSQSNQQREIDRIYRSICDRQE